ncbi:hypothetical protein [Luteibacter sp. dw_328]|uniref:hypothetical protein n=1 Tax=Luteibacter sp. dw_328 TaxID=2719796 RepID=UPI001BD597AB|nr:hypothetical protein [Luteibacter sp. dw_328]
MNEELSAEEWFEHEIFYFLKALRILELSADEQCEVMGNYNVAWEIQEDVSGPIPGMVNSPLSYFTGAQADALVRLASALKELPEEAIVVEGLPTNSREGSIAAMRHRSWEPLRIRASDVLRVLEPAIQRNAAYFTSA